ncbi:MAG: glycosyltransferase [Rubrivivax sp.]|nr:glycosyltransferase [Rubrivivax sp.]
MVRVLHVIPSMSAGGAERQLALLAPALAAAGAQVAVAYGAGGPNLSLLQRGAVDLLPLRRRAHHDPRLLLDLTSLIRRWRPDVVQTWILQMDVLGGLAAHWAGVPHVLSERCSAELYADDWKNRLRVRIGRRARAIVANSQGGIDYWREVGASVPMHLVRNGVSPADRTPPTDMFGTSGHPLLLAVGRLSEQKNVSTLVDALARALVRLPGHHALILGEGPLRDAIAARIAAGPVPGRIHLGGVSPSVGWWMEHADAFVSASLYEGHPNVVIEAAAAGCPLILSDIAAHREVLDAGAALFAAPHDAVALAECIVEAAQDRAAAAIRAARAKQDVAGLTIEAAAVRYLGIYEGLRP